MRKAVRPMVLAQVVLTDKQSVLPLLHQNVLRNSAAGSRRYTLSFLQRCNYTSVAILSNGQFRSYAMQLSFAE